MKKTLLVLLKQECSRYINGGPIEQRIGSCSNIKRKIEYTDIFS